MSVTALEKPGASAAQIVAGGKVGTAGSDFYIKTMDSQVSVVSPSQETTGDGDTYPEFDNNGLLYGDINLTGAMVASQAIGLANLVDGTKNPTAGLILVLGGARRLGPLKVLIEGFRIRHRKNAVFVGVALQGKVTGTAPGSFESAVSS